jgi:translation initiation factor 3 subunit M
MSNLFNALPRRSALRPVVYYALLNIALANDQLDVLKLSGSDVERWLTEWDISPEEKSIFWKTLVDAHTKTDQLYVLHDSWGIDFRSPLK